MNEQTNSIAFGPSTRACPVETVGAWGEEWLNARASLGYRNVLDDRRRWNTHVAAHDIALMPLTLVTEADAREWLHELLISTRRGRSLAANTCRNALNLIRASFTDACEARRAHHNPFRRLRIPRARGARSDEAWTVLSRDEQHALLSNIPDPRAHRLVAFAIGTGLGQGEQWYLRRHDVVLGDEPHVRVRLGTGGRVALSQRTVPLFGIALRAVTEQLEASEDELVWASPRGGARAPKVPSGWCAWLRASGITRAIRWQDLRHTCAASLVSGWWGRVWSLEEVREMLGHSSITVTARYSRFAKNVLAKAALETQMAQRKVAHEGRNRGL